METIVRPYFIKTQGNLQLTKNFKVSEFKSRSYPVVFIGDEILEVLQNLRDRLGVPINVNSGFRNKNHNDSVGGSTNSAHLLGLAADISCNTVPAWRVAHMLYMLYYKQVAIGLHTKENYVHVDTLYRGNWYKESLSNTVNSF